MLSLVQASSRVADITPQTVQRAFGVPVKVVDSNYFGYGQRLPGNWGFSIEKQTTDSAGTWASLTFSPIPGMQASLRDICEPDFARFTAALESMGFARHAQRGEHGRWLFDGFERPGMQVEVYADSEPSNTGAPAGPLCVKMVMMR